MYVRVVFRSPSSRPPCLGLDEREKGKDGHSSSFFLPSSLFTFFLFFSLLHSLTHSLTLSHSLSLFFPLDQYIRTSFHREGIVLLHYISLIKIEYRCDFFCEFHSKRRSICTKYRNFREKEANERNEGKSVHTLKYKKRIECQRRKLIVEYVR